MIRLIGHAVTIYCFRSGIAVLSEWSYLLYAYGGAETRSLVGTAVQVPFPYCIFSILVLWVHGCSKKRGARVKKAVLIEENKVTSDVDRNKCLKQIELSVSLLICASCTELPPNISTIILNDCPESLYRYFRGSLCPPPFLAPPWKLFQ